MGRVYIIIFIILFSSPALAGKTLTFTMADGPLAREAAAVLRTAYAKIDIRLNIQVLPSRRTLMEADSGVTDGEVGRIEGMEKEFANLIRIDVPINTFEGVMFTCDKDISIRSMEDLRQYKVGVRSGIVFSEQLTRDIPHMTIDSMDTLFALLARGRLDIVITQKHIGIKRQMHSGFKCIRIVGPTLGSYSLYHYLNKRHQDIAPVVMLILQGMSDSGEIERIISQERFRTN